MQLQPLFRVPAFFLHLSEILYFVLDCVGVNTWVVKRRRDTFLHREVTEDVFSQLIGDDMTYYHFGSQSEGTTTPGLLSDIDMLGTNNKVNIMYSMADWQLGKTNCLMVRDPDTPPQHYLLQLFRSDVPLPFTHIDHPDFVTDSQGRVFYSNMATVRRMAVLCGDNHLRRGPSNSGREDHDFVYAFKCKTLPPEIMLWFTKMGQVYWPPQETFEAAKKCPVFLVPDGYHGSVNKDIEWRITPNLIERLLMFSLNILQIKCLVVLKIIKKLEFVKYIHHENCKFTSFHCKTALFFTLERLPPTVWTKCRLIECIVRCLQTIQEFLNTGKCPHFIVEGVDLFDGKLCRECQSSLERGIQGMIQDDMHVLFHLQSDDLGQRLSELSHETQPYHVDDVNIEICGKLAMDMFTAFYQRVAFDIHTLCNNGKAELHISLNNKMTELENLVNNASATHNHKRCIKFIKKSLMSFKASTIMSHCIQSSQPFPHDIWQLYRESLNTDVASSKLKLASMHYCRGELRRAASVLHEVEFDLDDSVQHVCGCLRIPEREEPSKAFCKYTIQNGGQEQLSKKIAFCVRFLREEKFCAPLFLWQEMYRAVVDDVDHRGYNECHWMDWAVVDAQPFMLYLQYLTYRGLGVRHIQREAFHRLQDIVTSQDKINQLYHPETVFNLFGHCCELEGDVQKALHFYRVSIENIPRNNAANWHKQRLEMMLNN